MSSPKLEQTRLWSSQYSPLRAFWLLRVLYLLLSADLWLDMIEHGGRYGVGDFNVAHFALLDRVLPLPTPTLYVGLLIAAGFLALSLALGPAPRWLRLTLAATYTLAWLVSIHDSYQHHYLLSWLLFWCAALPDVSARRALSPEPVSGWGLPMSCITCGLVYFFTGVAKSEPDWRSGEALRAITHSRPPNADNPGKFDGARDLLMQLGMDDTTVWQLFALATIVLQWTVALGYLAAAQRDQRPSRARLVLCTLGLLAALSFHALAEIFRVFEIGLFSYYMMLIACLLLGPAEPWTYPTRVVAALSSWLGRKLGDAETTDLRKLARPLFAALVLCASGVTIPLPGAVWATSVVAALLALHGFLRVRAGRPDLDLLALRASAATLLMWLALTQTSVPFDYYRRTAGELHRMGRLEEALSLYREGERHAPRGSSRRQTIFKLEQELQQGSSLRRN